MIYKKIYLSCLIALLFFSCKKSVKQHEDSIYSRHLQRHVNLTVITTPLPDEKEEMNLLLWNNSQDLQKIDAKDIIDSLYRKKLIQPLILVGIAGNKDEYGLTGLSTPDKPGKFNDFIRDELYPYIKKKVVIRKFNSITIGGCSLAATSAFDIAWNNADKISKAGLFSPSFDYAGKTDSLSNALEYIRASRKRPNLQLWLYVADNKDSVAINNARLFKNILEAKSSISPDDISFITDKNGSNDFSSLRNQFAAFLLWAFSK